jgi:hypothetical protein
LSLGFRKLGILAVLAVLTVAFGVWRQGVPVPEVEASLAVPGGISALPTAGPGIPGMADQALPAIIRARPPGNHAVVTVFCDPTATAPVFLPLGNTFPLQCPVKGGGPLSKTSPSGAITFEITRLYPTSGSALSTFTATGTTKLVCNDNAACDLSATPKPSLYGVQDFGIIVVEVDGGGANEIIEVRATDELGESRSVQIAVVDTIMAFGPTGPVSTASQVDPLVISYACDDVGLDVASPETQIEYVRRPPTIPNESADTDQDHIAGLDDLWDLLYGYGTTFGWGQLDNNAAGDVDIPLYGCGADTSSPLDDSVTFETDLGILSIDPAAAEIPGLSASAASQGILIPAFMDADCASGKSVQRMDVDSLLVWAWALPTHLSIIPPGLPPPQEGGCDIDFARNGVVTTLLLGNGEVGTATVKAQQGGGVSPPRTINGVFIGEPKISLFLTAPAVVGPEGGQFTVGVLDPDFRPVAAQTVQCTVDPPGGALMVVPQTGTTEVFTGANPGQVVMKLVPTGKAVVEGEKLALTCVADRDRGVKATASLTLSSTPVTEAVGLVAACNPAVSTWADGTAIETVAGAVTPAEALDAIWALNPDGTAWLGFSPAAPEGVNDLVSVNQLDAFFVCVNAKATLARPVV